MRYFLLNCVHNFLNINSLAMSGLFIPLFLSNVFYFRSYIFPGSILSFGNFIFQCFSPRVVITAYTFLLSCLCLYMYFSCPAANDSVRYM